MADEKLKTEFLMDVGRKEKRLPKGFEEFTGTELCVEFLDSIFNYCVYLIYIEDKKIKLEEEAQVRKIPAPTLLASETIQLTKKAKRMADNYSRLIYMNRSIGQQLVLESELLPECKDRLQFKTKMYLNKDNDNGFYNAIVKLFVFAMKKAIRDVEKANKGSEYMERVEIEVDRLFKTNVFNNALRNQEKKKLIQKYPELGNLKPEEIKAGDKLTEKLYRRSQIKSQL